MKRIVLIILTSCALMACGNGKDTPVNSDTTVNSTTPPAKPDTNPIGMMMGDTSIGINDSLKKDTLRR